MKKYYGGGYRRLKRNFKLKAIKLNYEIFDSNANVYSSNGRCAK
ncbi:hypothetical protein [Peptoniphilus faecalis]|nr:hypothetical protein [Peptoniphilus faecalis]